MMRNQSLDLNDAEPKFGRLWQCTSQRWLDGGFLFSNPILFLKN